MCQWLLDLYDELWFRIYNRHLMFGYLKRHVNEWFDGVSVLV